MKYILLIIAFTFTTVLAWEAGRRTEKNKKQGEVDILINRITINEKGLISFWWTNHDGTEGGLDYVTVKGFNNWLKGNMDSVYVKWDSTEESSLTIIPSGVIGHPCEQ